MKIWHMDQKLSNILFNAFLNANFNVNNLFNLSTNCHVRSTQFLSNGHSDALRDLVREKHPWRSVTFRKVESYDFNKSNTPP